MVNKSLNITTIYRSGNVTHVKFINMGLWFQSSTLVSYRKSYFSQWNGGILQGDFCPTGLIPFVL